MFIRYARASNAVVVNRLIKKSRRSRMMTQYPMTAIHISLRVCFLSYYYFWWRRCGDIQNILFSQLRDWCSVSKRNFIHDSCHVYSARVRGESCCFYRRCINQNTLNSPGSAWFRTLFFSLLTLSWTSAFVCSCEEQSRM